MNVTECVKCGAELDHSGRGRPSRFCSQPCKTSAEAEMRRLNTNLRDLESRRATWVHGPDVEATRAKFTASIVELQARFDHLAGVPASTTTKGTDA